LKEFQRVYQRVKMEESMEDNFMYKLPIQKCIEGVSVRELSDVELLAIIIGTGTKGRMLWISPHGF
jgi:DNA repair protein RadC